MCISCKQNVDVHKGVVSFMWMHADREDSGKNIDFRVDVINGWPLNLIITK